MSKFRFVISGYNENDEAMRLYQFDENKVVCLDKLCLNNPSYVTSYQDIVFSYTKNPLEMVAYKIINNQFVLLNTISLYLQSMTHLTYSEKNKCLYGASYLDGTIVRIDFKENQFSNLVKISHKELYGENSKCHAIIMNEDETKVLVVNIATDTLYIYDVNLKLEKTIELKKGIGPRHAIWINDMIYCITEYSNELVVIKEDVGAIQYISTLKQDVKSYGATLFKKNNKIYCTNRGEETIAIFQVLEDKTVQYESNMPVYGVHPRHMIEYQNIILSCNKNSHNVVLIDIEKKEKILEFNYANPSGVTIIE